MIKKQDLQNRIHELFGNLDVSITPEISAGSNNKNQIFADLKIELNRSGKGRAIFVAEVKEYSDVAQLSSAMDKLSKFTEEDNKRYYPLIIVPYMGEVGADFCESRDISWMDLSGNAHIEADNIYIHVQGKPNKYKRPGRPSNIFAPKSSRVSRFLLIHPNELSRQKTISEETDLGRGYVSKIVQRLEKENLILKKNSKITVRNPEVMLEAWRENYDFSDHEIIKGTVPAKSSQELLKKISNSFSRKSLKYAATGLGAAWLYTEYADFRLCSFYLREEPGPELLDRISFTKTKKGHNLWLVIPKDKGVMYGSKEVKGINCVHPVQLYLDLLKGHPERAKDAASSVKTEFLNWEEQ